MSTETIITTSDAPIFEVGDVITLTHVEYDNRVWKWVIAWLFRLNKPVKIIETSKEIKSIDSPTTLTVTDGIVDKVTICKGES